MATLHSEEHPVTPRPDPFRGATENELCTNSLSPESLSCPCIAAASFVSISAVLVTDKIIEL